MSSDCIASREGERRFFEKIHGDIADLTLHRKHPLMVLIKDRDSDGPETWDDVKDRITVSNVSCRRCPEGTKTSATYFMDASIKCRLREVRCEGCMRTLCYWTREVLFRAYD